MATTAIAQMLKPCVPTNQLNAMRTIKFSGILFLQHKLHIRCTPPKNNAEETLIADNWSDLLPDFYLEGDEASKWYDETFVAVMMVWKVLPSRYNDHYYWRWLTSYYGLLLLMGCVNHQ